ncbi:hypothetical protein C8R43DRAFT_1132291 [Mycena crocata]|nr:hypothetical protein C8R43DRAFT_1132291 [Mycena crocata]
MQFQDRYTTQLQDEMEDEIALRILHLSLIYRLAFPNNTTKHPHPDISATPGVRCLIIRIWSHGSEELGVAADILGNLLQDFIPMKHTARHLDEIIEGAGGTIHDLVSLAFGHMDGVTREIDAAPAGMKGRVQGVNFLIELVITNANEHLEAFALRGLATLLLKCGPPLREWAISQRPHEYLDGAMAYFKTFFLPRMTILLPPALPYLMEALEAGMLVTIVRCGLTKPDSVLRHVQQAFRQTASWDLTKFEQSDLWEFWTHFSKVARERLSLKAKFKQQFESSTRFCDNLPCTGVFIQTGLRCCARCKSRFYCSLSCQATDWRSGNHKAVCKNLGRRQEDHLSTRDKAFLRYLMDDDYQKHKQHVLTLQLQFMKDPWLTPFYTEFNYLTGQVEFNVNPTEHLFSVLGSDAEKAEWRDHCERMVRDPGRMQLHVCVTTEGKDSNRYLVIPLRTNSVKTHDALEDLA